MPLVRDVRTDAYCQGTLAIADLRLQTLELPWVPAPPGLGGHPDRSCVPTGDYELVLHNTVEHPETFALVNPALDVFHEEADVPPARAAYARTAVLLHVGNFPRDSLACILLGMARGEGFISQSRVAVDRFHEVVPWVSGHSLSISFAPGVSP